MNSSATLQERSLPATTAVSPAALPPAGAQGLLAVPRLRDLPMSVAAAEAKKRDVEAILEGVAVLGYN